MENNTLEKNDITSFTADSPLGWKYLLDNLKAFFEAEWDTIESFKIIHRCNFCMKKHSMINVKIEDNQIKINTWTYSCNLMTEKTNHIVLDNVQKNDVFFKIEHYEDDFQLNLNYYNGFNLSVPLTSSYPKEDFKVHGISLYKEKNLKMKQRVTENGLIILMESFIDTLGLSPWYSDTILINWK